MISLIRRAAAARTARVMATTSFHEGSTEPVCTAACRTAAARTRGYERAATTGIRF